MTQMFVSQYGSSAYEKTMQNFDRLVSLMEDSESVKYLEGLVKYRRDLDPSYLSRNLRQKGFYDYDISTVSLRSGDVVVDCGAYTGDTAMEFLGRADDITVYAVEGMSRNYDKLQNWISSNGVKNVIPIKKFLGDQRGTIEVFFEDEAEDPRSSFIIDDGKAKIIEKVDIATLDALFYENAIEFDLLKIDVEGADLQVIKGGGKSIQKCAPKIMAAAYHVLDHLWLIPDAVRSLNKDYKIYAGHHDRCIHEIEYYCGI
jgi:FkbM family methyltransferase